MTDDELRQLFKIIKTIAIVGLSDDSERPSYKVATYLKDHGYKIVPINPKYAIILNETCYPDLTIAQQALAPVNIDIVDLFRRPEFILSHVKEALSLKPKVIWMQEGIENKEAAAVANSANIPVVMNRCLMKEHQRLMI